jgi:hypothetical protein
MYRYQKSSDRLKNRIRYLKRHFFSRFSCSEVSSSLSRNSDTYIPAVFIFSRFRRDCDSVCVYVCVYECLFPRGAIICFLFCIFFFNAKYIIWEPSPTHAAAVAAVYTRSWQTIVAVYGNRDLHRLGLLVSYIPSPVGIVAPQKFTLYTL